MAKKRKRKGQKMPKEVLAHFLAKSIQLAKKKGIVPKLMK
jgi:hypothetical protein